MVLDRSSLLSVFSIDIKHLASSAASCRIPRFDSQQQPAFIDSAEAGPHVECLLDEGQNHVPFCEIPQAVDGHAPMWHTDLPAVARNGNAPGQSPRL